MIRNGYGSGSPEGPVLAPFLRSPSDVHEKYLYLSHSAALKLSCMVYR